MSRAANSLRASDVITTPIKLKYTASYDCSNLEAYGMEVLTGVNGPVTTTGSVPQETLNYLSIRHLFYSNFLTGSYPVSASSADNFLQSTAASGTLDADVRYFPTGSGAQIRVLSIPRGVFGQQVSRHGFIMSSSAYYLADDGNGNIKDRAASNTHVGNIIYPQGLVIITNSDYLEVFPYPPTAVDDYANFLPTDSPKTVNILANDNPGTGTLLTSSVVLSGGDVALFTNNLDGTVTLNTTTLGSYVTYYTVQAALPGSCNVTSNEGMIVIGVVPTTTTTTTTTSTTTTTTTIPTTTTTTSTTTSTTTVPTTTTTTSTTTTTTTVPTTTTTTSTTTTTTTVPTTTTTTSTTTTTTTTNLVSIFIDNNNSLDIPITGMTINGVAVTYDSGTNFTITAGNNGNFTSDQTGTQTVTITYGAHISGQNIVFTDSDNNITCKDLNGSAGSFTIPSSVITAGTTIYVTAGDGACA